MPDLGPAWRVRRTGGLLVPGFRKRFTRDGSCGVTYLGPLRIGAFDVVAARHTEGVELRYRAWPVVDVLDGAPAAGGGSIPAAGTISIAGRRFRFCRFRLER